MTVPMGNGFGGRIADFTRDRLGLLKKVEGLRQVAQQLMDNANVAQGNDFGGAIADFARVSLGFAEMISPAMVKAWW